MKNSLISISIFLISIVLFAGCKKDSDSPSNTGGNSDVKITTYTPQNITSSTVECGGDAIVTQGLTLTKIGICWSTETNPTADESSLYTTKWDEPFVCTITGLVPNTKYYIRAFALRGLEYYYGSEKTFTTLPIQPTIPYVETNDINSVTSTTAICGGNVISNGNADVIARGVCWSTEQHPTLDSPHTSDGNGIGSFISNITGLNINTKYYVRAYATNEKGTAYGTQKEFTTRDGMPTVTTNDITDITTESALCGGNITDDGGFEITLRGVCWSTNQNPTTNESHTTDGCGASGFISVLTNLNNNTKYYVRAYATNEKGTAYGEQKEFNTQDGSPRVITNDIMEITESSASCGGNVISDGGFNIIARGVCWSASQNPTIDDSHTTDGTGLGDYTSSITNINIYTTYYVRAYATNIKGTSYGDQKSFKPLYVAPTGAINGLFSINDTQQICFSQGNLQYQASTNMWKFADNQYDYIGEDNQYISPSNSGWIDLFGWGTGNNPTAISSNVNDPFYDWGINAISNGGNIINQWRTLTMDEWSYLFNDRATTSGIRYAKANVEGINGLILLPDNWSNNYYLQNVNQNTASFTSNTLSSNEWSSTFEEHGAVCLPAAGYRPTGNIIRDVGFCGYYWSSSLSSTGGYYVYSIEFDTDCLFLTDPEDRLHGLSVRLVHDTE